MQDREDRVTDTVAAMPAAAGLTSRLTDFFVAESAALDERRFDDWLGMLAEDFVYVVPVPMSREDPSLDPYDSRLFLAHESKSFLTMRFGRVSSDYAWAERPAAFVRHFVSNVRVLDGRPGEWTVASNVMVVRTRLPEPPTLCSAGRIDVVRESGSGFLLAHRTVHIDSEVPTEGQASVIY